MIEIQIHADPHELALLKRQAIAQERVADAIEALVEVLTPSERVVRFVTYRLNNRTFAAEGERVMLTVKVTEVPGTVDASVTFTDVEGNPAKVDGVPVWSVDDASIIDSITPAADGLSAKLHIANAIGASQVSLVADVDLGTGTNTVTFVDTVSVVAGDASVANFTFGAVVPD